MKALPLLKLELQRGSDCGLACIASLIGRSYEDVLAEASRHKRTGEYPHCSGLYLNEIQRIAKRLGCILKQKRKCNFDVDEGILSIAWNKGRFTNHVVILVQKLIFDLSDMTVWEPHEYERANKAKFGSILVPA